MTQGRPINIVNYFIQPLPPPTGGVPHMQSAVDEAMDNPWQGETPQFEWCPSSNSDRRCLTRRNCALQMRSPRALQRLNGDGPSNYLPFNA